MKRPSRTITAILVLLALLTPAIAHAKVVDGAGFFSPDTIRQLDQRISAINQAYGRDVLIVTVPSLNGQTIAQAAQSYINLPVPRINGVFIFISKADKRLDIAVGQNTTGAIPAARKADIRQSLVTAFKSGRFDSGILAAVGTIDDSLRATASVPAAPGAPGAPATTTPPPAAAEPQRSSRGGGGGMGLFGLLIIGVGVFVVFSIIRGLTQRATGGGVPPYGAGGGYGNAGGYGGMGGGPAFGGGGGFLSNFLGGIGGAMAGNWLYDRFSGHHDSGGSWGGEGGSHADTSAYLPSQESQGSDWSSGADAGWSSDGGSSWGSSDSGSWGGDSGSSWGGGDSFGDSSGGFGGDDGGWS